ncbi:aromatic ring-hydroxylating dioxygenase subunit alpha [Sphingobium sp. 15-1]|uniref:aromatic ring-hydroxylating dioxygenase subunit alpha n=1 Tax=Sphingobium sp. 15-1 TaxID=2729616 RepID=UPI0021010DD9|nr:aromatic ring-hydroxylating dioxygenase subunit alpha [Sphingobium sp. 15-1]
MTIFRCGVIVSSRETGLRPGQFPLNAWYMAAWSDELGEGLLSRRLLGRPVLVYRLDDGDVVACEDMCPHRFAPLSKGRKTATGIRCGYHGLHFDRTGRCDHNPTGNGHIPAGTQVRTFPIVERHRILWIWMGDPDRADDGLIPDFGIMPNGGAYANIGNYLHVKANCLLEIDNLMDLSHVNFIHDGTLGNDSMRSAEVKVTEAGGAVRADLWMPGTTGGFGPMTGQPCDQWLNMVWMAPTSMMLEFGAVPQGTEPVQDPYGIAFHIVTPETDRTTHYFFGSSGSFAKDEEAKMAFIRDAQFRAFLTEDNPMIEAVDERMDGADFWSMRPAILPNDKAAIRVRRRLEKMCREEAATGPKATQPIGESDPA